MGGRHPFFASCAPGLEPVLFAEARALRLPKVEQQIGGVYFEGGLREAWTANLWLRTAIRVFLRVARFEAADSDALYRGARDVDWTPFVRPEGTLMVDSQSRDSELFHTHFIQQRVKDAIADQFRERTGVRPSVDVDSPDLRVHAHLYRDRVTLSVDSSGGSLHKRGWRRAQGRAPLSETTAAGVLALSEWDQRSPLVDPFCGSGTLLIEALLLAEGRAPGAWREFGFERWPGHDAEAWRRFREAEVERGTRRGKLRAIGRDSDPDQLEAARENARSAGVEDRLELELGDALDWEPKPGWNAWLVTNPPYGHRVGEERELVPLYRAFGRKLHEECAGYRLALLSGNAALAKELGLRRPERTRLMNGALACELLQVRLGESS